MTSYHLVGAATDPEALPSRPAPNRLAATPTAVGLRGLTKSYADVQAVRGVDLAIAAGEIVAVLGPNGAGKSTINEMILGLVKPEAGAVEVFGSEPRDAVRTGRVGAMLQAGAPTIR